MRCALIGLVALGTLGCASSWEDDPILRLSATEALTEGKAELEEGHYRRAREYFTHAFEVEPNSAAGREALLLVADTLFEQGGRGRMIEAEQRYRDYLNRFPTSSLAPYVQYRIGMTLVEQLGRADRDMSPTHKAIAAFEELARLYPTSEHVADAEEQIGRLRDHLAEHEYLVGRFYLRYGLPGAAINRWEPIPTTYPDYESMDRLLLELGEAYLLLDRAEEARDAFARLREDYPQSDLLDEIPAVPAVEDQS